MRIFTEQKLKIYCEEHPDVRVAIQEWVSIVKSSKWRNFADVKKTFNSVDNIPSLSLLRVISLAVKDITLKSLYVVLCWLII